MAGKSSKRITSALIIAAVLALLAIAVLRQTPMTPVDSGPLMLMGTVGRIQLRCRNQQVGADAIATALEALRRVDRLMSTHRDDSELAAVNRHAATEPVTVSQETYTLLEKSLLYSRMTAGAFDITISPLLQAWKRAEKENRWPSEAELTQARRHVGYRKVFLSEQPQHQVRFSESEVQLNLDAIAKGYAVDVALAAVKQTGVTAALVDIGGEIACFGQDRPQNNWRIGIQDPFASDTDNPLSQKPRWILQLRDRAVATSGNYRRYMTIAEKKVSHIVDPCTGVPADKLPSVTVIAPRTIDADALATAVSVMGVQKGLALIETIPDTEALIVTGSHDDIQLHRSSGFSSYEITH